MKPTIRQKKINTYTNILLRTLAIVISIGVIVSVAIFYLISRSAFEGLGANVVDGHIKLDGLSIENAEPSYLNGEWEYFPDLFFAKEGFSRELLQQPQRIKLPLTSIAAARGSATYRMKLSIDKLPTGGLVIYVPVSHNHVNVFVNGSPLLSSDINKNWIKHSRFDSVFYLTQLDEQLEQQELVVSIEAASGALGLFHRDILISTPRNAFTLQLVAVSSEMLIAGMLLVMMISGFIFMMFRPNHKMITAMTLFDSLLMLRILFGLDNLFAMINSLLGKTVFTDSLCYSLQVLFIFLAGIAGIKLSHDLFDPKGRTPRVLTLLPAVLYFAFGVFFALKPELFSPVGIHVLLLILAYTFIGVIWQFVMCMRRACSSYYVLQIIKTGFIGLIIFFDIVTWNSQRDFLFLMLLYCLFFTTHIGFRLYDNNNSYKQVEVFNRNLERTIEERTHELELANSRLHELSIRDPLTNAYNRLHFERIVQEYILRNEKIGHTLFLAIFDLDWFKRVNDSYGHDEGDRQLVFAVKCCNKLLPTDGVLSRIGGEEFTVLLTSVDDTQALQWAATFRAAFEKEKEADDKRTTVSIGMAKYQANMDSVTFFKLADNCLYEAKNTGRNRICYDFGSGMELITK